MVRRIVSLVIIASMIMHCASRLGVLSYLYEKRHNIALTVGLIAEVPIAMCNDDYDFNKGLRIQHADSKNQTPLTFSNAQEIILFLPADYFTFPAKSEQLIKEKVTSLPVIYESSYLLDIFHPPSSLS